MSPTTHLNVVVLAAGQGARMKSRLPKVLHPLAGKPLLSHVLDTARQLNPQKLIVVYGHGGAAVRETITAGDIAWAEQQQQLGTGHAVQQAMPQISGDGIALILYGDVPLTQLSTLSELINLASDDQLALLTVHLVDPTGYGRIVRDSHGKVQAIVEHKDASDAQLKITEINTGILAVRTDKLNSWLARLESNNAQGEYYLTDIIAMAVAEGVTVKTCHPASQEEVMGINSRAQLAAMERYYQRQQAESLMAEGVTIIDPSRIDVRGNIKIEQDVTLDVNVTLQGDVEIREGAIIGPNCVIIDSIIGRNCELLANCVIEKSRVGANSHIGPFSRLRPGVDLSEETKVGNFVEVKNSSIGRGSKINHLSYVGDTTMGERVNVGAGTITCNYDGANKHRTIIGDDVFIGSDTQLVAPVQVGPGSTIGAGTTVTKDVPDGELTLSRSEQKSIKGWKRPTKKK